MVSSKFSKVIFEFILLVIAILNEKVHSFGYITTGLLVAKSPFKNQSGLVFHCLLIIKYLIQQRIQHGQQVVDMSCFNWLAKDNLFVNGWSVIE